MNATVDKILDSCNQPAVDTYVALAEQGKGEDAVRLLLRDEGHWLSEPEAQEFVRYIVATMPQTGEH